jgi:hypothetical protein
MTKHGSGLDLARPVSKNSGRVVGRGTKRTTSLHDHYKALAEATERDNLMAKVRYTSVATVAATVIAALLGATLPVSLTVGAAVCFFFVTCTEIR